MAPRADSLSGSSRGEATRWLGFGADHGVGDAPASRRRTSLAAFNLMVTWLGLCSSRFAAEGPRRIRRLPSTTVSAHAGYPLSANAFYPRWRSTAAPTGSSRAPSRTRRFELRVGAPMSRQPMCRCCRPSGGPLSEVPRTARSFQQSRRPSSGSRSRLHARPSRRPSRAGLGGRVLQRACYLDTPTEGRRQASDSGSRR